MSFIVQFGDCAESELIKGCETLILMRSMWER